MQGTQSKPPIVNRHDGPCRRCGTKVGAGTGTYDYTVQGCLHPEGACKTTTKTYRTWQQAEALRRLRQDIQDLYAARGYRRESSGHTDHPDIIRGHGLIALVGGTRPGDVFSLGIRVYRAGVQGLLPRNAEPVYELPRRLTPAVPETGDYHTDRLAEQAALLDLLDSAAESKVS